MKLSRRGTMLLVLSVALTTLAVAIPMAMMAKDAGAQTSFEDYIIADFNGDGRSDLVRENGDLHYGSLLGVYGNRSANVNAAVVKTGDFDGDGFDDLLRYNPGTKADLVSYGAKSGFELSKKVVNGNYNPIIGDYNGDGRDDILWYGLSSRRSWYWFGQANRTFTGKAMTINNGFAPFSGDFNGDKIDDIFWYRVGTGADWVWSHDTNGRPRSSKHNVTGHYDPTRADLNGDGIDDIYWRNRAATGSNWVWQGASNTKFKAFGPYYNFHGKLLAGQTDGTGGDDIVFISGSAARLLTFHPQGGQKCHKWTKLRFIPQYLLSEPNGIETGDLVSLNSGRANVAQLPTCSSGSHR